MSLVVILLWWLGAVTFWFRFRVDIDRDKITIRARALDPRERMVARPLADFAGFSTRDTVFGPQLFFGFTASPSWLAPLLWLSGDQLEELKAWIWDAAQEMVASGAPVFAARDDDGQAAAAVATIDRGPALAPWAPPPRPVPLWHRAKLILGGRVLGSSFLLMIFAPAAASDLFATDVTSPWLSAAPTVQTTAVVEACERTDFEVESKKRFVRRFSYRFEVDGATWRSSSYDEIDCLEPGTVTPVDYPVGFPSASHLTNMDRHPMPPEGLAPVLVAIFLYALGELAAAFLAGAHKIRYLREGRISLAVFETKSQFKAWYGSTWLLVFRVLVGGREVRCAYDHAGTFEHQQLVIYDPRRPARREFTGLMGGESLSAFGGIEPRSVGGTLFIGAMLAVALWLVFRAIRWTVLNQA